MKVISDSPSIVYALSAMRRKRTRRPRSPVPQTNKEDREKLRQISEQLSREAAFLTHKRKLEELVKALSPVEQAMLRLAKLRHEAGE